MTGAGTEKNRKMLAVIKLILLAAILAGVPAFLYFRYGAGVFSKETVSQTVAFLRQHDETASLIIIAVQVIQVVICIIPGQPIQFASSYMFGVFWGFVLSITGAVLGTVISFYLAKFLGTDAVKLLFGEEKTEEYRKKIDSGRGLLLALLIYLIPGFPKDAAAYFAGVSGMRFWPFLLVATIGRSPGMLGSLLLGHYFGRGNIRAMIILGTAVCIILALCVVFRKKLTAFMDRIVEKDKEREAARSGKR